MRLDLKASKMRPLPSRAHTPTEEHVNFGTILVHLDHSDRCAARTTLAARLARTHGSHLVGLVPTGLYDGVIPAAAVPTGATDYIAESAGYLRRRTETVTQAFNDRISGSGPLSYEVRTTDDPTVDAVVRHGRASDLVVLGQPDRAAASDTAAHDLAPQVMLQAGRPVLVVPYAGSFEDVGKHVVVAWDGSREAAVAMRDALPLLGKAVRVTLASLRAADDNAADDRLHVPEMSAWLLRHGIKATAEQYVTDIAIADSLLSRASDLGADLIVMGGYGHTRFRELLLGGVTRDILAHMTVPVLMAH